MPTAKQSTPRQKEFGSRVRAWREERKLSQERLAHEAGIERTYVAQIEAGRRNPALENICKLAKALGVDTADLVQGLQDVPGRS